MCVAYQWLIWLTSQNSLLHEKFSNRCMAYQWLTWLTSQDLVTSQELLASNRGVTYQNSLTSLRNFEYVCGISVVDLVDFTGITGFIEILLHYKIILRVGVWHISA